MHSFGAEKFYELLYTYKNYPSFVAEGTKGNKRSDFAYRCSRIYGIQRHRRTRGNVPVEHYFIETVIDAACKRLVYGQERVPGAAMQITRLSTQ